MFIRFVIHKLDSDSGRRQGLFQAATTLQEAGVLSPHDYERLHGIRTWFSDHLRKPTRFSLSPRPHAKEQAISWFKDTASDHISKMREFKEILESYGVAVEMIKARRLGYVVYEDEFQVTAYPFSDTPT